MLSLPFARFLQVVEQASKAQREEMRRLAFLGWQVQAPLRERQISFAEYLDALGLGNERPAPVRVTKEQAEKRADEILAMFEATNQP
ncbi:MAG TPA: hypothetical protein GXX40_05705 [Firmicutes bacterium]|nr:hypothetical protein [Bacillota bacterium]